MFNQSTSIPAEHDRADSTQVINYSSDPKWLNNWFNYWSCWSDSTTSAYMTIQNCGMLISLYIRQTSHRLDGYVDIFQRHWRSEILTGGEPLSDLTWGEVLFDQRSLCSMLVWEKSSIFSLLLATGTHCTTDTADYNLLPLLIQGWVPARDGNDITVNHVDVNGKMHLGMWLSRGKLNRRWKRETVDTFICRLHRHWYTCYCTNA